MKLRKLTADEVEFQESTEDEFIPVQGNYMATDDEEADKRAEQELLDRLHRGDNSAWCILVTQATWKGFIGRASLGAYVFPEGNTGEQNAEYAKEDCKQLRTEALDALNSQLQERFNTLSELANEVGEPPHE